MDLAGMMQALMGGMAGALPGLPGETDWRSRRPPLTAVQRQMWDEAGAPGLEDHDAADAVQRLLAAHPGTSVDVQSDEGGFSLLHTAALRNHARLACALLDAGAALDQRVPSTHETPLAVPACWGQADVIRLLLERGALAGEGACGASAARCRWLAAQRRRKKGRRPRCPCAPRAGANPHLVDMRGNTALQRLEEKMRVPRGSPEVAARYAEAHRLIKAAVEVSPPLSRAAKKEGCGGCGRTDIKLDVCARCRLRAYCGRACQAQDWPVHKQRQVLLYVWPAASPPGVGLPCRAACVPPTPRCSPSAPRSPPCSAPLCPRFHQVLHSPPQVQGGGGAACQAGGAGRPWGGQGGAARRDEAAGAGPALAPAGGGAQGWALLPLGEWRGGGGGLREGLRARAGGCGQRCTAALSPTVACFGCTLPPAAPGVKLLLEAVPSDPPTTLLFVGGHTPQETRLLTLWCAAAACIHAAACPRASC